MKTLPTHIARLAELDRQHENARASVPLIGATRAFHTMDAIRAEMHEAVKVLLWAYGEETEPKGGPEASP